MKTKIAILLCLGLLTQFQAGGAATGAAVQSASAAAGATNGTAVAGESKTNPPPSPVLAPPAPVKESTTNAVNSLSVTNPPAKVESLMTNQTVKTEGGATNHAVKAKAPLGVDLVEAAEKKLEKEPAGEEISPLVTYDEAELIPVIKALARQARINLVFDPRMTSVGPDGKSPMTTLVTLRLENVTARNVLDTVLKNYGYVMIEDTKTGIGRVAPKDEKLPDPLFTRVMLLQYTSPTNVMEVLRRAFPSTRNQFVPDVRTSQLVVMATEDDLKKIDMLITDLDKPTRQVLIEAKLLETSHNPQSVKGIDWSGTLQAQRVSFGNGLSSSATTYQSPGAAVTTTTPSGRTITTAAGSSSQTTYTTTSAGDLSTSPGLSLNTAQGFAPSMGFLNADGVSAVLSFLNQSSDTEVVATPRAVTLDNETATLSVMRAYPVRTTSPGSANVAASSQVGYTNVGTMLIVTPRISGGTNVAMKVQPEVSNIDGTQSSVVDGKVNTDLVFAYRRVEANVVVPSGHTLVMGGLISDSSTKKYIKVPVLGDLPGVGLAFRKEDKQKSKQNLIIFITPTILQSFDFQKLPSSTFLQSKDNVAIEAKTSAWDSGTPYDWNKSKK
jgi:type II secretory pathway component GspD/PulD (secretin)